MTKEIALTRGFVALVDDDLFDELSQHKWYATSGRCAYAARRPQWNGPVVLMHRVITDCPGGMEVDHINGEPLDNRHANLRIVTRAQNGMNLPKPRSGLTSQFKGVCFEAQTGRWSAQISINNHTKKIGRFDDELMAAYQYDLAARRNYGEYARLNLPHAPVDGTEYFCPVTEKTTTIDGVVLEGTRFWVGCHACERIELENGTVFEVDKQWHPAREVHP